MTKLTVAQVNKLRSPGKFNDGHGLLLHVVAADKRYWTYRYTVAGRERSMSLGSADVLSLSEARALHAKARAMLAKGVDPLAEREQQRQEQAARVSFAEAVERYIAEHGVRWRGYRAVIQWRHSLTTHANPHFGAKPVSEVTKQDVLKALRPIWQTKPVTAHRVRNRTEMVLRFAAGMGWRSGENPAAWRGNLDVLLPRQSTFHVIEHRAALPWQELPALMARLLTGSTMAEKCLAFIVFTGCRSLEGRGVTWPELDLDRRVWTIPASRTKNRAVHRVPLSEGAMMIVRELAALRTDSPLVFLRRDGKRLPMAKITLTDLVQRMGHRATVHGMRSSFADWAAEHGYSSDAVEAALGHVIGIAVRRAYARSDLLEARRLLMQAWSDYLTREPAEVIPLRVA
jgi:integrase